MDRLKKKIVSIKKAITKKREADWIQDRVVEISLLSVFCGLWITFHVGISFTVCGCIGLAMALGLFSRRQVK